MLTVTTDHTDCLWLWLREMTMSIAFLYWRITLIVGVVVLKGWLPSAKLKSTFTFLGKDFVIVNTCSWQNPYQEKWKLVSQPLSEVFFRVVKMDTEKRSFLQARYCPWKVPVDIRQYPWCEEREKEKGNTDCHYCSHGKALYCICFTMSKMQVGRCKVTSRTMSLIQPRNRERETGKDQHHSSHTPW